MTSKGRVSEKTATVWTRRCTLTGGKSHRAGLKLTATSALALCLMLGAAFSLQATPQGRKPKGVRIPFSHMYWAPVNGRVGYHMVSKWQTDTDDLPAGIPCAAGALPDGITKGIEVYGTRPPGLIAPGDDMSSGSESNSIEGTPREPGDWQLEITIHHIHCTQGRDQQDYGDRTVQVSIHIDP